MNIGGSSIQESAKTSDANRPLEGCDVKTEPAGFPRL